VVIALLDPDPRVIGKGADLLRSKGITVDIGLMAAEASGLNSAFIHFQNYRTPYTTLKAAVTLDGKTATAAGHSQWISGTKSREYVHRLRAQSGAVMVGIGTALADNPQLTARLTSPPPRQPLRVIVDSHLRTPENSRAVQLSSPAAPLLIVTTDQVSPAAPAAIEREGVETLQLPSIDGRVDLCAMMKALADRQIISVLVEGGGELNAALLRAGLAHSVLFFVAPMLFGGRTAPTAVGGVGVEAVSDAVRLKDVKVRRFGLDYAFEGEIVKLSEE
jgi:diaminohydroxyphosphoribosylaminopyrimidine deaminase/5-amino-6-(5-phosphoribosylamino)uracil reductase